MTVTVIMSTICANCGEEHDACTEAVGTITGERRSRVEDGDVTVCMACGMINIFDEQAAGGLRMPYRKEWAALKRDRKIFDVQAAWRVMDAERRARSRLQ